MVPVDYFSAAWPGTLHNMTYEFIDLHVCLSPPLIGLRDAEMALAMSLISENPQMP